MDYCGLRAAGWMLVHLATNARMNKIANSKITRNNGIRLLPTLLEFAGRVLE